MEPWISKETSSGFIDVDLSRQVEKDWAGHSRAKTLHFLKANYELVSAGLLSGEDLIDRLRAIPMRGRDTQAVDELCRRLISGTEDELVRRVVEVLSDAEATFNAIGESSLRVDRLLQRLLREVGEPGLELATRCVGSSRRFRVLASFKYFQLNPVNSMARNTLANLVGEESHLGFLEIVVRDAELAAKADPIKLFEMLETKLYLRATYVKTMVLSGSAETEIRVQDVPAWLWGVSMAGEVALVPSVIEVAKQSLGSPDLINRSLLCINSIGDSLAKGEVLSLAEETLGLEVSRHEGPPSD